MNDLEDRLRSTLRDVAGAVPHSPHARADLERRLAARGTARVRASLLATAAAATVLIGVAVPVVLSQDDDDSPQARTPPPAPTLVTSRDPHAGTNGPPGSAHGYLFAGPIELGRFQEGGVSRAAVLTVEQDGDGERACVLVSPSDGSDAPGAGCVPVPTWPTGPTGTGYVATRAVLGGEALHSGPLPNLLLFMTAPEATTLEVRHGDGSPADTELVAVSPTARFYLADFGDTSAGFGYTAKDAAGNVLEDAIT